MRSVKVIVNPDGTTQIDWSGFQGSACMDAAAQLSALMAQYGITSEETNLVKKPEYYETVEQQTATQERITNND